jgi:hypothetical protein
MAKATGLLVGLIAALAAENDAPMFGNPCRKVGNPKKKAAKKAQKMARKNNRKKKQ